MKHARLVDMESGSRSLTVNENATLSDVLAAAGVSQKPGHALSQNGRPAQGSDAVKDKATVMLLPESDHG